MGSQMTCFNDGRKCAQQTVPNQNIQEEEVNEFSCTMFTVATFE